MADSRPEYRHGRIIGAYLRTKTRGKQLHPAVILTPDNEIVQPERFDPRKGGDNVVVVIGISTKYKLYSESFVKLPFHSAGHPATKLTKDSAAIIGWYDIIEIDDDRRFWAGDVPREVLAEINTRVRKDIAQRIGRDFSTISEILPLLFES
jgi:hypothetical protein